MTEACFQVHTLPKVHDSLERYANKYSELRLRGLHRSPEAFSGTLENEKSLDQQQRNERLQRAQSTILVAVDRNRPTLQPLNGAAQLGLSSNQEEQDAHKGNGYDDWLDCEWIGQVTLIGPMSQQEYDAPFKAVRGPGARSPIAVEITASSSSALGERLSTKFWHMTALYVSDEYRGKGIAKLICQSCFDLIARDAAASSSPTTAPSAGSPSAELRIVIKPDNQVVINMYKSLGFIVLQEKAALLEAIYASREAVDLLPHDALQQPKYTSLGGIVMVKHIVGVTAH